MNLARLIPLTVALLALGAPVASAHPAMDPAITRSGHESTHRPVPTANRATIAAHHDEISNAQWVHARGKPLTVETPAAGSRPILIIALGVLALLGLMLTKVAGRQILTSRRARRAAHTA